jgi:DNA-binding MarR family transcriptional regulator
LKTDLTALFMEVVPHGMREFRKEMRNSRSASLTVPQFRILAHIWRQPRNNKELAEEQGVSVAAMSRMIDWLCKHGLVERKKCLGDRREILVKLTPSGKKRFARFREEAHVRMKKRLDTLTASDQKNLHQGLTALATALARMGDSPEA